MAIERLLSGGQSSLGWGYKREFVTRLLYYVHIL